MRGKPTFLRSCLVPQKWQSDQALISHLTAEQQNWLTYSGSLTKRLREFTDRTITLHVLYDQLNLVTDDASCEILKISESDNKTAWIRRIEFRQEGTAWISATVTIPGSSITDETKELTNVGKGSIGDVLFKDPALSRTQFEFCIEGDTLLRRSIFHYKEKPLLIVEKFSPAFMQAIE